MAAFPEQPITKEFFEKRLSIADYRQLRTEFLLYSNNQYTEVHKDRIRRKMMRDFDVEFPSRAEELPNPENTRKRISELNDRNEEDLRKSPSC